MRSQQKSLQLAGWRSNADNVIRKIEFKHKET